jgi:hypothetical protein
LGIFCDAASSTTKKKVLKIDGHLVAFSCPIAFAQDVQDDFFQSGERPENWGWIFESIARLHVVFRAAFATLYLTSA